MPIYEYYCPHCDVRFSHLARRFDEPAPPCPRCGARDVQRLISAAHPIRPEAERRAAFDAKAREIDRRGSVEDAARYLTEAGSLLDEVAPIEQKDLFREMVKRRAEGASERDLQDLVNALPLPPPPEGMEDLHPEEYLERYLEHGPIRHEEGENPHEHAHGHEHEAQPKKQSSPRKAKHIGWG